MAHKAQLIFSLFVIKVHQYRGLRLQDCRSLHSVVMTTDTLLNRQWVTDRQREAVWTAYTYRNTSSAVVSSNKNYSKLALYNEKYHGHLNTVYIRRSKVASVCQSRHSVCSRYYCYYRGNLFRDRAPLSQSRCSSDVTSRQDADAIYKWRQPTWNMSLKSAASVICYPRVS